ATAMSMRPSWLPVVLLTNALPVPAFMGAPVGYRLPLTVLPYTKPFAFGALDEKVGQPLDPIVALQSPFAPLSPRSACAVVARPRVPIWTSTRVVPLQRLSGRRCLP